MVSSKLTEEEEFLKKQFQTLKNLKKEIKQLTLKRKQEQAASTENGPPSAKQKKAIIQGNKTPSTAQEFSSGGPNYNIKPPQTANAAANTEAAKKLLKSGAIKLKVEKKTSFKRSSNLKRRLTDTDGQRKPALQHFSTGSESTGEDTADDHDAKETHKNPAFPQYKPYGGGKDGKSKFTRREKKAPRRGNTLYVHGFVVSETFIQKNFSKFGNIVKINMERGKSSGFVSFDTFESAEEAINEMDDALVDDCRLKVSLARHQPMLQSVKSNTPWAGLAERGDKGSMERETRQQVSYDDDFI